MAFKTDDGKYMGGLLSLPLGSVSREDVERYQAEGYLMRVTGEGGMLELFGPPLTDIRPSELRLDCKHCYTDDAPTVLCHEHVMGDSVHVLCAICGAGLTPPEATLAESLAGAGVSPGAHGQARLRRMVDQMRRH